MKVIDSVRSWIENHEAVKWVETVRQDPQRFVDWVEGKHPLLAKRVLNAASEVVEPQLMGVGVIVRELTDKHVEIRLPYRWKNHSAGRSMDSGVLISTSEFAARQLWYRHIDLLNTEIEIKSAELTVLKQIRESVWCRMHLNPQERDRLIHQLHSTGEVNVVQEAQFFCKDDLLAAQASLSWRLKGSLALAGSTAPK